MEKKINKFKIGIAFNKHVTTVDLRKIVAISKPEEKDSFFKVYFENCVWNLAVEQYQRLFNAWISLECEP